MPQELRLEFDGLVTNQSPERTKPGALVEAENVNIDAPDTVSSRRGFKVFGNQLTVPALETVNHMTEYQDRLHIHYSNKLAYDTNGLGVWSDYSGTYTLADSVIGFRSQKMQSSFYFTAENGVRRIESLGSAPFLAGIPEGLGFSYLASDLVGSPGTALVKDNWYAYRIVWGRTLPSGQVLLGSPSGRTEVLNTAVAARNLNIRIPIPTGIDTTFFFQVYRSVGSGNNTTLPSDECALVLEDFPTGAEVTAGVATRTDVTPDSGRGPLLYTNPTQDGILAANGEPPFAKDLCLYKNCMFYANVRTRQSIIINLLGVFGVGSSTGLAIGDTITVNGTIYTGAAVENVAANQFLISTQPTPALRIAESARSICNVINQSATTNDVYVIYVSSADEFPGKMLIRRRSLSGASFTVSSSNAVAFDPPLDAGAPTVSSNNEVSVNRVYISRPNQPDAVPLLNYVDCGSNDDPIVRIIALRDSVFVFKQNEIYRIIGEDITSFQVNLFDSTARLYGPRTATAINNEIFCYSDQGIVSISEGGVRIRSWDIENRIKVFTAQAVYPDFTTDAWSVSYESDRRWLMFDGTRFWAKNILTETWTNWELSRAAGTVYSVDGRLYLADSDGVIYQERKDLSAWDFADNEYAVTVTAPSSSNVVAVASVPVGVVVGYEFRQGDVSARIDAISGLNLTLSNVMTVTAGAATIYAPINCFMEFSDVFSGNPASMKRYREFFVGFRDNNREFELGFSNNFNNVALTAEIEPSWVGLTWGSGPWGGIPWGGLTNNHQEYRRYFPPAMQRALWGRVSVETERAFTDFSVNEAAFTFEQNGERFHK